MEELGRIAARTFSSAATAKGRYKLANLEVVRDALRIRVEREIASRGMKVADHELLSRQCERVSTWLTNPSAKQSLLIIGFVGSGKTTFLSAIHSLLSRFNVPSLYYVATDLQLPLIETPETFRGSILHGDWATYLLMDDIGEEPTEVRDYGRSWPLFTKIVAERYTRMLPFIITSNLNLEQIEDRYGQRTADRLREIADVIVFNNNSYRK